MTPFRNILRLFAGDFVAKALQFATVVYLARVLGVDAFGVLELALAATSYLLLVSDFGFELWATRQVPRERSVRALAGRVLGLRLAIGVAAYTAFLCLIPAFPSYDSLRMLLVLGGLGVLAQALGLKWALLGRERLTVVALGLVVGQVVATAAVITFVRGAADVMWVALARAAGDLAAAAVFLRHFIAGEGGPPARPTIAGWRHLLGSASVLAGIQILGVLSYNFDSLMLGLLLGPEAVGHYGAAYKLVTIAIAASMTYYTGLFPALARTWLEGGAAFLAVAHRSLRLAALSSLPLAACGTLLAGHAVAFVFGPEYAASAPVLRILCWSAALVALRGTYRNGLTAMDAQGLDLRAAAIATVVNVTLNLVLIPRFGMVGAAAATVSADVVWLALAMWYFGRRVGGLNLVGAIWRPLIATGVMVAAILACLAANMSSIAALVVAAVVGGGVYVSTLAALREPEVLVFLTRGAPRTGA